MLADCSIGTVFTQIFPLKTQFYMTIYILQKVLRSWQNAQNMALYVDVGRIIWELRYFIMLYVLRLF
jgi:hypothetical protein